MACRGRGLGLLHDAHEPAYLGPQARVSPAGGQHRLQPRYGFYGAPSRGATPRGPRKKNFLEPTRGSGSVGVARGATGTHRREAGRPQAAHDAVGKPARAASVAPAWRVQAQLLVAGAGHVYTTLPAELSVLACCWCRGRTRVLSLEMTMTLPAERQQRSLHQACGRRVPVFCFCFFWAVGPCAEEAFSRRTRPTASVCSPPVSLSLSFSLFPRFRVVVIAAAPAHFFFR